MPKLFSSPFGRLTAVFLALALCVLGAQAANASPSAKAAPTASSAAGTLTSQVEGTTADGRSVTGSFVPQKFVERGGALAVTGVVQGVIRGQDGATTPFRQPATFGVQNAALFECDILHLDLAPLDLDVLGLQVHLSRVVLDIVAVAGAGNLLGNLLCAVTGLLDGPIFGPLGQLIILLNQILAILGLG